MLNLRKFFFFTILLLFVQCTVYAQTDTILNRYKSYLLHTAEPDSNIKNLLSGLKANGKWDDINYHDTERANWQPLIHLKRVQNLALVWADPQSKYYHNDFVWKGINAGIDDWIENRYKSSNWWHNEIGVPQYIRDIIILTKDNLPAGKLNELLKVLSQYRLQNSGAGANLTWSADLGFHYALLTNNVHLMQQCIDLLKGEIKITTGEGVQPDFSFHQHGKRLQMYQYGSAFLWDNARIAWQVRGTQFAFPEEKTKILIDFVLDGWQWMARGIHTVPGTMDRSASRVDALNSPDIRKLIPYLIELSPGRADQLKKLKLIQDGRVSLQGFRFYPYSDFTAYQRKDFSFFLKTISTRTLYTEAINNENLKGHLLNSGDAYLIANGKEYFNLMPVWDWNYLPGITAFSGASRIYRKPFTGAVGDGTKGFSVMDYQMEGNTNQQYISAHKFWACNKDMIVCLIAGLTANAVNSQVYTTLEQSRWQGNVTVNKPDHILTAGDYKLNQVAWVYHHNFAYIPLKQATLNLKLEADTGSWKSINSSLSSNTVKDNVFKLVLVHGVSPSNLNTGYILAYCKTPTDAAKLMLHPKWKIIRNDSECQAVQFNKTLMAAFFSSNSLRFKGKELSVDQPCLIMIAGNDIYASSEAGKSIQVHLKWGSRVLNLTTDENGFSVKAQ